jgi:hypothetical protein
VLNAVNIGQGGGDKYTSHDDTFVKISHVYPMPNARARSKGAETVRGAFGAE